MAIIMRSFVESMAQRRGVPCPWSPEIAMVVDDKIITFAQLLQERKDRQAKRLSAIRRSTEPTKHAAYVWTFFCPGLGGFAFRGWWLYIWALKHDWKYSERDFWRTGDFILSLMRQFPCGLLPLPENFDRWKEEFGRTYARPGRFKKQGLVPGWIECGSNGWPKKFTPAVTT